MARLSRSLLFFLAVFVVSGCGSTIRGVGKDVSRVGRGVKMIFISEEDTPPAKEQKPSFADFLKADKSNPDRRR